MESSEPVGFDSYGSTVIVDNYANAKKLSEKYMFPDKIEPILSSGVATIGGNILFQKVLEQLYCPGLIMRYNYTQNIE